MQGKATSQNRSKKFIKDIGIYAIGNLGSKVITFLLIPLYTFYIDAPSEFGYYDICVNTAFAAIPLISLQLNDGAFRFLIETHDESKRTSIVTFVYRTLIINSLIIIGIGIIANSLFEIKYLALSIGFGLAQTLYDVVTQIVRGLGKLKAFVISGIGNTFLIALTSLFFVAIFNMGIPGVFLSNIIARILVVMILNLKLDILHHYFNLEALDSSTNKTIIRYSLPLIPMALCWWFINGNNYYFLQHFCGLAQTGLYGFVGRFSGILYILCLIFYQTWQQNAIEQYNSPDRNQFFSTVFNNYLYLISFLVVLFSYSLRILYPIIIGPEFQISSQYLFINAIYVMIFSLSQFFELGYQCSKQTKYILPSLIVIAACNILGNWILVQPFGLYGIIASNIISWSSMLIYRLINTRKFMKISFEIRSIVYIILLVISGILYYQSNSTLYDAIIVITTTLIFIISMPISFRGFIIARVFRN